MNEKGVGMKGVSPSPLGPRFDNEKRDTRTYTEKLKDIMPCAGPSKGKIFYKKKSGETNCHRKRAACSSKDVFPPKVIIKIFRH